MMKTHLLGVTSICAILMTIPAALAEMNFHRIASFDTSTNLGATDKPDQETAPEIIAATQDGMTLVYTDSPAERIGFVDIKDAANPKPAGFITLSGEPTSVDIIGNRAYVGVNTSESFTNPSGFLAQIDLSTKQQIATCDLGGQPDSIAAHPKGDFIAVAIENERDEDLNDGELPQLPAGNVTIVPVADGVMNCNAKIIANVTGLATYEGLDPEPEFVDVNDLGEIVVTLQENNHLVILAADGSVVNHFNAGSVTLTGIDENEEQALRFNAIQTDVPREADAVNWIDNDHFATADEGDLNGGSRGWTIYNKNGDVVYDDNLAFERSLIEIGHYPEKRSGNKGVEPESIKFARFGDTKYVFVGSERGSVVGVYTLDGTTPTLQQLLPSGVAPEGITAIPERNLLITANEKDFIENGGVRAHVMIYQLQARPAQYPTLTSKGADTLFGWTALSGLVADAEKPGILYAVNDSFLRAQPRIFTIDANQTPARLISYVDVTRDLAPAQKLDMEGIALDGKGGFWIASEGRTDRLTPHAIYNVDAKGVIKKEIALPTELLKFEKRFASEGITRVGDTLWIAIQREWKDDPKDRVKLVSYNLETNQWGAVHYPLQPVDNGWVGLSEITAHNGYLYIVERDNQIGSAAKIKRLYKVALEGLNPAPLGGKLPVVTKELVRDLLPDLQAYKGYVQDKVEGFAIDASGNGFFITDNDGVDDHSGETFFWGVGKIQ